MQMQIQAQTQMTFTCRMKTQGTLTDRQAQLKSFFQDGGQVPVTLRLLAFVFAVALSEVRRV